MAQTPRGRRLTEQHRLAQLGIASQGEAVARRLWRGLDPTDIRGSWPAWLAANTAALATFYSLSQDVASEYIRDYRLAEVGSVATGPVVAPSFDAGVNGQALSIAGPIYALSQSKQGSRHPLDASLNHYGGLFRRQILAGGRMMIDETTASDRRARGWRRVTDGDPCAFCAMLATRGAVGQGTLYRSRETATTAGGDSMFGSGTRYHPYCGCTAEIVYGEWEPNEREQGYIDAYREAASQASAEDGVRTQDTVLWRMRQLMK